MRYLLTAWFLLFAHMSFASEEHAQVDRVLDALHDAASKAQSERYFSLFSEDATFIGTDVTEVWDIPAFKAFADPYFSQGKGWTYYPVKRNIHFSADGLTAWFDEVLTNEKYGMTRGTGVVLLINNEWKIVQYHLAFPIPNDIAGDVTKMVKQYGNQNAIN